MLKKIVSPKNKATYIGNSEIYGLIEDGIKHIVYDLSIEDIEERKQKAIICNSAVEVATLLKVRNDVVFRNRIVGKKIKGINGKHFAVRIYKQ
jgi:hypothetical protein